MLSQLFLAYPNPVDAAALYASAWGMPFDPECDPAAFKSAAQRLNGLLRSVSPAVSLTRTFAAEGPGGVLLSLPAAWEAIL